MIIRYNNSKAFLREHPFLDPITQPVPVIKFSFIYPGDEIVVCHKLVLPDDAQESSINDVKLISAKCSIIAQKQNVFSEEFSREFQAMRSFELDSFTTMFNNTNARYIPWGSLGADGYAQNLLLNQDRNWLLPSGNFRRQIKFSTTHTNATSKWEYLFSFPILFRWEYWVSLLNADNDFFDITQPQNGQNHWWYHYFVSGKWLLKARLELSILKNGVPAMIRSDLHLTPSAISVNDYSSNADWTNKSVKTSAVGGTPSNTPSFVYRDKYTEVWGLLDKVSPWATNEQGNISAVVWIEPYEGAGINVRTRGSSLYTITPESVFVGLNTSITDDSGLGVQDGLGNFIVTDQNGHGAKVIFNGTQPEKVKVYALIDHNKLRTVYPGITRFTIYVRIYNSTLLTGGSGLEGTIAKRGEEIKQDSTLVYTPLPTDLCDRKQPLCPFNLDVFADLADADDLKNDKSDFYEYGDNSISSIAFTLQKNDSICGTGSWTDKATITNNNYGRFFAFGLANDFSGASFMDDYRKQYTGMLLEWRKVLIAFGAGMYRMKIAKTDVFGNATTSYDQRTFFLKEYHCNLVNNTVRIDTVNEGLRGSILDRNTFIDYADGWSGQIRLKGVLKYKGSPYVKEYNQYGDADFNAMRPVIDEQTPKFTLAIRPVPGWMDFVLSTNVLQSDEMYVTDYNSDNRHSWIRVPVMNDGEFTPSDNNLRNPLSAVKINLAYGLNNLRKRNSQ